MFYFKPYWGKTRITMNLRKRDSQWLNIEDLIPENREINRKLLRDFNFKQSEEQLCLTNYMVLNQNSSPSNITDEVESCLKLYERVSVCVTEAKN